MTSEILEEASITQTLKGLADIQLYIFKHLPTQIDLSFHSFLLCIPSVSKITQFSELQELYLGNLFSRKI